MRQNYLSVLRILFFCFFISMQGQAAVIYVNANLGGGNNDGADWQNAFLDLQDALTLAQEGDEIWVAKGNYLPTEGTDREISFELKNGVALYGGFEGDELLREQRDWALNETILNGDIGVAEDSSDNSYTILYMEFCDSTTIVDGFSIINGTATNAVPVVPAQGRKKSGGGIYVNGRGGGNRASPRIRNCTFQFNFSKFAGGAIYFNGSSLGSTNPHVVNCVFKNNHSNGGGAICKEGGSVEDGAAVIRDCTFLRNAASNGGAIDYSNTTSVADLIIRGCSFSENGAILGGAIDYFDFSPSSFGNLLLDSCTFFKNTAFAKGGAARILLGENEKTASIQNSTFDNNQTPYFGDFNSEAGGAFRFDLFTGIDIKVVNCLFKNNRSTKGGAISLGGGNLELINSVFISNFASIGGGVVRIGSSTQPLTFSSTNCTFYGNYSMNGRAFEINKTGNPSLNTIEINNCIIWNNTMGQEKNFFLNNSNMEMNHCIIDVEDCDSIATIGFLSDGAVFCGENMLFNQYPLFKDTAANDLRLQACSPAINAGNNTIIADLGIGSDLIGSPRILDGIVDLGAFESLNLQVDVVEVQPVSCAGSGDGSVIIEIPNGCAPFSYEWENGTASGTGTKGLSAGNYQFTITDALGKQAVVSIEITEPPPLTLTPFVQPADCETGTGGSAGVSPNGGTAPFQYLWDNQATDSILANIPAGNYSVTVTDANACTATTAVAVTSTGDLSLSITISPISCHDSQDGTATVTPLTGLPPFDFLWMDGQTDSLLTDIGSGDFSVTVTDANGCSDFLSFNIQAPQVLNLAISANDISCPGLQDGTATVTVSGGTSPYGYLWSNFQTAETAVNLPPGEYWVTVTDVSDCSDSIRVEVGEPDSIGIDFEVQNANQSNASAGAITLLAVFGGAPPYSFLWNTGDTTQSLSNLPAGDYSVTVEDAAACQRHFAFTVDIETAVQESDLAHLEALLSPNPAKRNGAARLLFNSSKSLLLEMKLFDSGGKLVRQEALFVNKGSTDVPISAPFISGLYFVQLSVEGGARKYLKWVVVQ